MWPYRIRLTVDSRSVTVATDDSSMAAALATWGTQEPRDDEVLDFLLEVHPPEPRRGRPRRRASLCHGSECLARSDDADELRAALLRVLATVTTVPAPGRLRLEGTVLEKSGRAVVVGRRYAAGLSSRWLRSRGWTPWWGYALDVDVAAGSVHLPALLGGADSGSTGLALHAWLVPQLWGAEPDEDERTRLARLLTAAAPHVEGLTGTRATQPDVVWQHLVALVRSRPPQVVGPGRGSLLAALDALS